MKITVDVDVTPEELRRFLGLPDVAAIQEQMVKNAQDYLQEAGQTQYREFVNAAMQPMMAYQDWVQRMVSGDRSDAKDKDKGTKK